MADENGVWRTISGRRVFIRDGQSLTDAMRESGKFGDKSKIKKRNMQNTNTELSIAFGEKRLAPVMSF
jgi:hypothetical protein